MSSKPGCTLLHEYGRRMTLPIRVHLTVRGVTIKFGRCDDKDDDRSNVALALWLTIFSFNVMQSCPINAQLSMSFNGPDLESNICWRLTPQVFGPVVVHFFIFKLMLFVSKKPFP